MSAVQIFTPLLDLFPEKTWRPLLVALLEEIVILLCWKHLGFHWLTLGYMPTPEQISVAGDGDAGWLMHSGSHPCICSGGLACLSQKFRVLVSRRGGECMLNGYNTCPFYFHFCSYLDRCLMKCVFRPVLSKFGVCNGGIIKWGSGNAVWLGGGQKKCILMFFRWAINLLLWGLKSPKGLTVMMESRELVILVVDHTNITIDNNNKYSSIAPYHL